MDIWEIDKIYIFIAFAIPGFISLKVYELINPSNAKESSYQIIDAVTYSCINYSLLLLPIAVIESNNIKKTSPFWYITFYMVVLFIAPILWALAWQWLRKREIFQKNAPHPTRKPWDWVFAQRKSYWVKITLKDGTKLAGPYADKSFASSSPAEEQIYLEESWLLNEEGGLARSKKGSSGVIVMSSEISYLELMDYEGEKNV